jgi:adenine-specific DNA-methyltransferase
MQNLLDDLTQLLQADQAFISDGAILKNAVIEAALNMDPRLLELLMQSDTIKAHFFTPLAGALVFDKVKFQDFVSNKAFLPDSYTAFKNRIGLTDGRGEYLSQSRDVVLAWPYKDCVLEGGMTKEDRDRNEVFWNTTLAPDDITRLFEPKVLTGWERWDTEAVAAGKAKPVGEVSQDDNLLIKGNNLLALHSLKARYAGKVKLIYIDPPYNTGSDEFRYNDAFNHSSWMTFIKNRIEAAKSLLNRDGAIFLSVDSNELGYLMVLLDEAFGKDNMVVCAAVKRGSVTGHKAINAGVVNVTEFVLGYAMHKGRWQPNKVFRARGRSDRYSTFITNIADKPDDWNFVSLLDAFANSVGVEKSKLRTHFGFAYEDELYSFVKQNAASVIRTAEPDSAKISKATKEAIAASRKHPSKVFHIARENEPDLFIKNGSRILFYADRLMEIDGEVVTAEALSDWWDDTLPNDLHNEGGVTLKKGKKPERLMKRILEVSSNQGDLVMDFFSGSGTFAAVAQKLGRQWIAVEQLEYTQTLPLKRLQNVLAGDSTGVSKAAGWQGGGSFVYAELAASNSAFADRIEAAPDMATLQTIHADIQATGYLRYDVDLSAFDTDDFAALPLDDAKRVLMDCLDTNHLYVNLGSLGDAAFDISDEDATATRSFYGITE